MNDSGKPSLIRDFFATKQGQEAKKWFEDNFKANEKNENAIRILKEALQSVANHSEMTPEVKEVAETLVYLIEDRVLFEYSFDVLLDPVVQIARVEIPTKGGNIRAEKDKRTAIIKAIGKEAMKLSSNFKSFGYQAKFVREMLKKYPQIIDDKAVILHLNNLKKSGKLENYIKK